MTTKTERTLEWIVTLTLRVMIKPEHSENPDLQSESRYHVIRSVNLSSKMRIQIPFSNMAMNYLSPNVLDLTMRATDRLLITR